MKKYTLITLATIVTLTAGICIAQTDTPAGPGPTGATNPYSAINATSQSNTLQAIYARSATYSVSMDYSKTSDQLMAATSLASMNKDANISLGILNQARNVGTGSSTLTVKCVPQGNFLPATNYAGTPVTASASFDSARITLDQYFGYMHTKGYRPLTANELLATVAQYPNSLSCPNNGYISNSQISGSVSAYGSAFELPDFIEPATVATPGAVTTSSLPVGTKIFIPTISNASANNAYAISNILSFKLSAPQLSRWASTLGKTNFLLKKGVLVVVDPNAPTATTIKISALPTQSASQALGDTSGSGRYVTLTGQSYPITVNYDAIPSFVGDSTSIDIPNSTSISEGGGSGVIQSDDSTKYSGTHNINMVFATIRNSSASTLLQYSGYLGNSNSPWIKSVDARNLLINWLALPANSGYRLATAREIMYLNVQYPNQFSFISALGSWGTKCGAFSMLIGGNWGTGLLNRPATTPLTNYQSHGTTRFNDMGYWDMRTCGNGWIGDSSKDPDLNGKSFTYLSSCSMINTYNINEWRFALVPKSSYNPAGY